jgi:hypothetical protein
MTPRIIRYRSTQRLKRVYISVIKGLGEEVLASVLQNYQKESEKNFLSQPLFRNFEKNCNTQGQVWDIDS